MCRSIDDTMKILRIITFFLNVLSVGVPYRTMQQFYSVRAPETNIILNKPERLGAKPLKTIHPLQFLYQSLC